MSWHNSDVNTESDSVRNSRRHSDSSSYDYEDDYESDSDTFYNPTQPLTDALNEGLRRLDEMRNSNNSYPTTPDDGGCDTTRPHSSCVTDEN